MLNSYGITGMSDIVDKEMFPDSEEMSIWSIVVLSVWYLYLISELFVSYVNTQLDSSMFSLIGFTKKPPVTPNPLLSVVSKFSPVAFIQIVFNPWLDCPALLPIATEFSPWLVCPAWCPIATEFDLWSNCPATKPIATEFCPWLVCPAPEPIATEFDLWAASPADKPIATELLHWL